MATCDLSIAYRAPALPRIRHLINDAWRCSVRHRTYAELLRLQYFPRMTKAESERIQELCSLIAVEQDRAKFLQHCEELNRLLSAKGKTFNADLSSTSEDGQT